MSSEAAAMSAYLVRLTGPFGNVITEVTEDHARAVNMVCNASRSGWTTTLQTLTLPACVDNDALQALVDAARRVLDLYTRSAVAGETWGDHSDAAMTGLGGALAALQAARDIADPLPLTDPE